MAQIKKPTGKTAKGVKTAAKRTGGKAKALTRMDAVKKAVKRAKKTVNRARANAKSLGSKVLAKVSDGMNKRQKTKLAAAGAAVVAVAAGMAVVRARKRKKKNRWLS
jgi:hypothetical protein